jgi:hypothetical protein
MAHSPKLNGHRFKKIELVVAYLSQIELFVGYFNEKYYFVKVI